MEALIPASLIWAPVQHATNQTLLAQTQTQPTVNITTSASVKPEPPHTYDGNPNCVTAFIQELWAYFYMAHIMDIQNQIFFAISKYMEKRMILQQHGQTPSGTPSWNGTMKSNGSKHSTGLLQLSQD
ncbi:hypothetical protein CPB84DRAFT_1751775 [Gymnopilus junonius]|uniref:Uncharacterized protein n=1 Tax=Gymnopilus junonius TaxID=109634 RepID=A0A9P5THQ0_GYMJU|nr:hypothetical protein CPB84DRAFT_1751775 [Gymnopilus junonius]